MRRGVFIAMLLLAPALGGAAEEPWRLEKDRDGIKMYSRAVEGWSIREIRGVMRVEASLSSIVAVLEDVDAAHELSDVISEAKIVHRDSETHYRYYSAMDLPWPVSDRDMVDDCRITQDEQTLAVTIRDVAVEGDLPPRNGFVRMTRSVQTWTLTPSPEGVVVELRILADPAGPIPAAIINAMSIGTPYKTLANLRGMVRKPQYADAKMTYLREPPAGNGGS